MMDILILSGIFFIMGYLEMHYRFPFFPFSRYFRKEPEIIADAPHRIGPGRLLPVSIIIKDSDRFPITLNSVLIRIMCADGRSIEVRKDYHLELRQPWFEDNIFIDVKQVNGTIQIWPIMEVAIAGKKRTIITHNVKTTYQYLLKTIVDPDPLPGNEDYWWGDLHFHSNFTEDYVEFGAPVGATQQAAHALGLDFLAITDHSYDLDDLPGSWTANDPDLKKWRHSREVIKNSDKKDITLLIPGEEVTCQNNIGRNVHLLVLNHPTFFPGAGDSAEKFLQTKSELTIPDLLQRQINDSVAIAAHPFLPFSKLERFLLNRGKWNNHDTQYEELCGFQIVNGQFDQNTQTGLDIWINLLLKGFKKFIFAGNDAHGNFNFFHQIKLPMWSTHIHRKQILGYARTGIIKTNPKTVSTIIRQLKKGRCIISDGPAIDVKILSDDTSYILGDTVYSGDITISINCFSSGLFGSLACLTVFRGLIGENEEEVILEETWKGPSYQNYLSKRLVWPARPGYIRCQLATVTGKKCFTNPIWIDPA